MSWERTPSFASISLPPAEKVLSSYSLIKKRKVSYVLLLALIYLERFVNPLAGEGEKERLKGMSQAGDKPLPSSRSSSDDFDSQVLRHSPLPHIQQREDHDQKRGPSLNGHEGSGIAKYRECQKNHAAAIGGNARDGCGEFMPSGEEGTLNALKCSACNCHRNFHRREIIAVHPSTVDASRGLTLPLLKSDLLHSPTDNGGDETPKVEIAEKKKRRYRTKFTAQQKEKMLAFATKAGWKMQKLDEHAVAQFCQELGIERRVLKVWMHNNKHNYLPSKC